MNGGMCKVHVHGSLAEPIHLVERNQKRQELIRDSLLERGRWDASENSDESKMDFTSVTTGSQYHGVPPT